MTETPPELPSPSTGSIYGFNVAASRSIQQLAAKRGVPLRLHSIIYKLIDELKEELSSKLPPLRSENIVGEEPQCEASEDQTFGGSLDVQPPVSQ